MQPPPGRRIVDDGLLTRVVGPDRHPLDHMIFHSRLTEANADAVVKAELDGVRRAGRGLQWNVYGGDVPSDLVDRLVRAGMRLQASETVLVLPASDPRASAPTPPGIEIRRITRGEDLADFHAIDEAVWGGGFTAWVRSWLLPALAGKADPVGVFVAYVAARPVGAAWVALPKERSFAHLFGGTVLPTDRRKGVYRALVSARADCARVAGIPWLVTDANKNSAPILQRLGFLPIGTRTEMVLDPPAPV